MCTITNSQLPKYKLQVEGSQGEIRGLFSFYKNVQPVQIAREYLQIYLIFQ